jgi:hypothetical protein
MGFKGKQPVLYKLIILKLIILGYGMNESIPVVARSKSWFYGRSLAEIAGSNPAGDMDVFVLWVLCVR